MSEGSLLLLEEYFSAASSLFLTELGRIDAPKKLGAFAERWVKDPRPWAREQLRTLVLETPHFEDPRFKPLYKRLYKLVEKGADDRACAWFLVLFDRSLGRKEAQKYNWQLRASETRLKQEWPRRWDGEAFSVHTRHYLRRRAWRYFRHLGFRAPERYLAGVLESLLEYRDADLDSGVHLLDRWGLVHILFQGSPILEQQTHGWRLKEGAAMRELKPAPFKPELWTDDAIFTLLLKAKAQAMRRTARAMLRAKPALLQKVPAERVFEMLEHDDAELQALGVELLPTAAGLESVPLEKWTRLLEGGNLEILDAVCAMMAKLVKPEVFTTTQLTYFATGAIGPVARLGLDWLKRRALEPAELLSLAQVRARAVAADAVAWARQQLSARPDFQPEWVLAFLDSGTIEVRKAAWTWFSEEPRARHRLDLWSKIVETPYDDVRSAIVGHLERFADMDTALRVLLTRAPLETVWATVLLNIHRGNRAKRLAAGQIAGAIERDPAKAKQFLPLLAIAARSIRAPEFRAGLAALVRSVTNRPEIAAQVAQHFPELKLAP